MPAEDLGHEAAELVSLANGEAQRTATQLKDSVAARAVTDQAKGILMHALGCDPDEALRHLRRESQRRHIKVTEVAARIVADHGSGGRGTPSSQGAAADASDPRSTTRRAARNRAPEEDR